MVVLSGYDCDNQDANNIASKIAIDVAIYGRDSIITIIIQN